MSFLPLAVGKRGEPPFHRGFQVLTNGKGWLVFDKNSQASFFRWGLIPKETPMQDPDRATKMSQTRS